MPANYKFTYFDLKGLGEPIRFLFAYGGIDYEDVRIPRENWSNVKSTMPFAQLPILEVNGKVYNQSIAIGRYIARKVKLYGNTPEEELEIDMMVDNFNDFRIKVAQFAFEQNETEKEKKRQVVLNETIPFMIGKLDEIAKANNGYLATGKLTFADIFFVGLLDTMNHFTSMNIIDKYSNLKKVRENVLAVPAIKNWVEKRPKTDF